MDSHCEAANSRPGESFYKQGIVQGSSKLVEIPKLLSDILATADPSPGKGEKVIVFEYLPRQSKLAKFSYVVKEIGKNLRTSKLRFFQLAHLLLAVLIGSVLYQLKVSITGWGHVQLVLLEGYTESSFRGKIFGITNDDNNTVMFHRDNGKDWKPADKASYAFGGCTRASKASVQHTSMFPPYLRGPSH
jgi:hypothetical protein